MELREQEIVFKRSLRLLEVILRHLYTFREGGVVRKGKSSEMYQATLKKRYCGHLYSPPLPKWTLCDHGAQVYTYVGRVSRDHDPEHC
jgi:hypothetical protein